MKTKHPKEMKCIVCDFKGLDETEITKHYEEVHLTSSEPTLEKRNTPVAKCKNGQYLKQERCNFLHEERDDQPWEQVQPRRSRQTREHHQSRPVQTRQMSRQEVRQEDRHQQPRREER